MIQLVTGATGTIGRRVVAFLRAGGHQPRALVRDPARARSLLGDDVELVVGDLEAHSTLETACSGVDALFLVTSGPNLAALDAQIARTARASKVPRMVKLSSLGARARSAPTAVALWHAEGEKAIRETGIPYTFVQSVGFMSNALAWAPAIKAAGVVRASTGNGRIAMIHPDDVAAVATAALLDGTTECRTLAVTGPVALTYAQMTAAIGQAIGRELRFDPISDQEAHDNLRSQGMPVSVAAALVMLWREVREGQVDVVTSEVARMTGRPPRSFEQWATENAPAFR